MKKFISDKLSKLKDVARATARRANSWLEKLIAFFKWLTKKRSIGIGPIQMLFYRIALSLTAGVLVALILFGLDTLFNGDVLTLGRTMLLGLLFAVWIGLDEDEEFKVPPAHGAPLTFLGRRTPFWLEGGDYSWIGRRLFIKNFEYTEPETKDLTNYVPGFVYVGEIVIPIWNSLKEKEKTVLSNVARDGSTIRTNLTVVFTIGNLFDWIYSSRPIVDIAERSRSAFRTAISFFNGTDCAAAKTVLGKLMTGHTVLTVRVPTQGDAHQKMSMIQDLFGTPLFHYLERKEGETKAERDLRVRSDKKDFLDMVRLRANDKDLKSAQIDASVSEDKALSRILEFSIDEHLLEVIDDVGAIFKRVSVGDVAYSEEVETQANKAAGEFFQRDAQIASARAAKAAAKEMLPDEETRNNPAYQDASVFAAALDNKNIRIVYLPGGSDSITKAAVAAASQVGNNNGGNS